LSKKWTRNFGHVGAVFGQGVGRLSPVENVAQAQGCLKNEHRNKIHSDVIIRRVQLNRLMRATTFS